VKHYELIDYDVIFLSYDEPNADENYQHLLKSIPWAKRVHGIKGSDTAHKECAKVSDTERLIIIDGDNYVHSGFLNQTLELDFDDDSNVVFSWPSRNRINGLLYGNGGIKCWPKKAIIEMKTHENADPTNEKTQVDFCWDLKYIPIDKTFSDTVNNITPLQSFRAGFREGVKMSLVEGTKPNTITQIEKGNLRRLKVWLTVGTDISNGIYAILGAWYGFYKTVFTEWDHTLVRDFDYVNDFFHENIESLTELEIKNKIEDFVSRLKSLEPKFIISNPFTPDHSIFYKSLDNNPNRQPYYVRSNKSYTGYDIIMITYDEVEREKNFQQLLRRFPWAKRIHGIKGIHQAHIEAAKLANTDMFWVVDGDAVIEKDFNFSFKLDKPDDFVRVWRCKNPINDLVYGYGGVKLLPKLQTINMSLDKPDMTTSISTKFIPIQELSNVTKFNVNEFHTWRSAFRECCKLSSKIIDRQKDEETIKRLDIWCTVGKDRLYGKYALEGAIAGRKYGEQHKNDIEALKKINDFQWLKEQYYEYYQ
jgi:hypothetical protein